MIQKYAICSPDFPFHDKLIFDYEQNYAESHTDLPARVFLSQGDNENLEYNA